MFDKKKMSIDFTLPEYQLVKDTADNKDESSSSIINSLVGTFLPLKPSVKKKLCDYCMDQYGERIEELQNATTFDGQDTAIEASQWLNLSRYFKLSDSENKELKNDSMKRVMLKDGYLIIPKEFIILNDTVAPAEECMYAGVVEARNGSKFGIPHFVFFSNCKYGHEYNNELETKVYEACEKAFPDFRKFFNMQIKMPNVASGEGRQDPEFLKNMDEWDKAPTFALFHIVEKGDPIYWNSINPNYEPPYGAMIIRKNDKEK